MNKLIAALAMIVLATSPAFAAHTGHEGFRDGQRFSGRHPDAFEKHDAFDGHR